MYNPTYSHMERNWKRIIEFGSRPFGSKSLYQCGNYILEEIKALIPDTRFETFHADGFAVKDWSLSILSPNPRKVHSYLLLGSGCSKGFRGTVHYAGKNRIWNMYAWDRFYIVGDDGNIAAYITVRSGGKAIPQTLADGNTPLPHFIVGEDERETFFNAQRDKLVVEGFADSQHLKDAAGYNIVCPFHKAGHRMVLCAHYDTVYNTPGAYDNSAGAAVLMEVARRMRNRKFLNGLDIVWMDGEEFRLLGSRHMSEKDGNNIDMVLNVDGVGRSGELEVWSGPEPFEREVRACLSQVREVESQMYICPPPPGSDQAPYYEKGIPACTLTFNDQEVIHSPEDTYDPSKLHNMAVMVQLVERLLEHFNIVQ